MCLLHILTSVIPCSVTYILEERPVVLSAGHRVYRGPAVLTEVLETSDTAAEEWSWFSIALDSTTFIADLVIEHIRFDINLWMETTFEYTYNTHL